MEYYQKTEARAELFSIIKGIELRIFQGESDLSLFEEIIRFSGQIVKKGYGNLFFILKLLAFNDMLNCICGLFDKFTQRDKYPVQSIPRVLFFIKMNYKILVITNRDVLLRKLDKLDIIKTNIKSLSDEELTLYIFEQIDKKIPQSEPHRKKGDINVFFSHELNKALYNLQMLRDKKVAHFEDITLNTPDEKVIVNARLLIEFARNFVDLLGNGYLEYDYSRDESNPRKKQAENFSKDLNRLLSKAEII